MHRLPPIALLLVTLMGSLAAGEVHVDGERGFRIEVPEGWSVKEAESEGIFVLTLLPPGSAGGEAVTVRVFALSEGQGAEAALKRARDTIAAGEGYSDYEETEGELAGRPTLDLRVRFRAPSGDYRIVQSYLAANGFAYQVQRHAENRDFDERREDLEAVAATFDRAHRRGGAGRESLARPRRALR